MKNRWFVAGVFVLAAAVMSAGVMASQSGAGQTDKPKESSQKPAGKAHTMTGCLEKGTDENTFRLTNIEGGGPKTAQLHADAKLKLSGHVGHKVAITGTDIDPKTAKKGTGSAGTSGTGTSGTGASGTGAGATDDHHMRVQSMKHIAGTCS
jgi:hypothetical protein